MYDLIKVAHLLCIVLWLAGTLSLPIVLRAAADSPDPAAIARAFRWWYLRLFSPALIGVWGFGLTLMVMGGWSGQPWMWAKLVAAFALSGLHGPLSARLRRMANAGETAQSRQNLTLLWAMLAMVAVVLLLVELKPF